MLPYMKFVPSNFGIRLICIFPWLHIYCWRIKNSIFMISFDHQKESFLQVLHDLFGCGNYQIYISCVGHGSIQFFFLAYVRQERLLYQTVLSANESLSISSTWFIKWEFKRVFFTARATTTFFIQPQSPRDIHCSVLFPSRSLFTNTIHAYRNNYSTQ